MSEQATLSDAFESGGSAGADEDGGRRRPDRTPVDECGHGDAEEWPAPMDMHVPDDHEWAGRRPVWCPDCLRVVDRVG